MDNAEIVKRLRDAHYCDQCEDEFLPNDEGSGVMSPGLHSLAALAIERLMRQCEYKDEVIAQRNAMLADVERDRDEADEASATNAENVVRLAGKCDSLLANIRYAAGILDKIVGECAAQADVPKPAETEYALCYIRALAGSAILDLGLAVGSQARPIFGVDMARGLDKTVTHSAHSGEAVNRPTDSQPGGRT